MPAFFTMYLLAAMRAASSASDEMFSFSQLREPGSGTPAVEALGQQALRVLQPAARMQAQHQQSESSPDQMDAVREEVHTGLLGAHIIDADLGVGHTAACTDWVDEKRSKVFIAHHTAPHPTPPKTRCLARPADAQMHWKRIWWQQQ